MNSEWFTDFWRYRELLYFLAWRDVKVRYKQAALGASWAVIQPLLTMVIFTLFFGRLARVPSDGIPYPLFSFCALVPWTYFSTTLSQAGNSLVSNSSLITKVYFPRALLPAATVLSGLVDFAMGSTFLALMMIYYRVKPGWSFFLVPFFLGAMNVRYRDVKYALPFLVQIWLFVTPIIYPIAFLTPKMKRFLAFNPMAGFLEGFRSSLFNTGHMDWSLVGTAVIITT